jgi:hypothetical protein
VDPPLRASDADREATAERLRLGMGEGRLTVEDLEERLDGVYRARTRGELEALVTDLPAAAGAQAIEPAASGSRVPVRTGEDGTRWVVSVMGGSDRRGQWRLARRCRVVNIMGGSDLDLNDAEFAADRVELTVFSLMGGSKVRIPESLHVEVSKFGLMAGHDIDLGSAPTDPGGPILRLRLISIMAGADLRRGPENRRRRRRRLPTETPPPGSPER